MVWIGDLAEDQIINRKFTTVDTSGQPTAFTGGVIAIYKGNGTGESTSGVTLSLNFDSRVGLHNLRVDTSAHAFYAVGNDYSAVATGGTIAGKPAAGYVVAEFSIQNRYTGANVIQISGNGTAADNAQLMFDGTGYAGGTTKFNVNTVQISGDGTAADNAELMFDGTGYGGGTTKLNVALVAGSTVNSVTNKTGYALVAGSTVNSVTVKTGYALVAGSTVNSVTNKTGYSLVAGSTINSVTNKTGYSLVAGSTINSVTVKTGYSLVAGSTVNSVTVKTGYALADASSDAVIADAVWNALTSAYGGAGSYGATVESLGAGGDATAANQTTIINHLTAIKGTGFTGTADSLKIVSDAIDLISSSSGAGANSVTITITVGGSALADADVWVTSDAAGTTVVAGTLQTNSLGKVTFLLDAGSTYYLWSQKDGYNSNRGTSFVAVAD